MIAVEVVVAVEVMFTAVAIVFRNSGGECNS